MKKTTILTCLCAGTLAACAQEKLQVSGSVPETLNGKYVYLLNMDRGNTPIDSALVSGGKVKLETAPGQNKFAIMAIEKKQGMFFPVYLDSTPITFDATGDTWTYQGSDANNLLNEYDQKKAPIEKEMAQVNADYVEAKQKGEIPKETMEQLYQRADAAEAKQKNLLVSLIKANTNNVAAAFLLQQGYTGMSPETLQELVSLQGSFRETPQFKVVEKYVESVKKTMPGADFTHFEMEDTNGTKHSTKEFVGNGKYVLVDFWASWCGPCRAAMPGVKKVYEQYKDKGFDVLGISFDNQKDAWTKAIDQLGLKWNHLSDLKGWGCAAAGIYGIRSIPFMLLVGPDGKIIARNLHGEALQEKIAELIK